MSNLEGLSEEDVKRLAEIQARVMTNPKTRIQAMKLIREAVPEQQLPDLDAFEREEKREEKLREELKVRDAKLEEIELRGKRDTLIQKLIEAGTIESRAQFEEVEKFGVENKIADYEKAAHFWKLSQQPSEPSPSVFPDYIGHPAKPALEGLDKFNGNVHRWAEAEMHKAVNDLRTGKVRVQ